VGTAGEGSGVALPGAAAGCAVVLAGQGFRCILEEAAGCRGGPVR